MRWYDSVVPERRIDRRELWHRFLVICALSAAAIAAPLLDLYGKTPEIFVANRTTGVEIVVFALLVALVPPLLGAIVLVVTSLIGRRTADVAYFAIIGVLGALLGLVVSRQLIPDATLLAIVVAVALTAVVLLIISRIEGYMGVLALALPAVVVLFLAFSPAARLIWEAPADGTTGDTAIGAPAPVIFIQLDEFPEASLMDLDGTVNENLFPNFARLADEGTWYRNAFSASIATTQSVPATLTGRLVDEELSPSLIDHPDNLFTLLGGKYDMHVIEWVVDMCPEELCEDYAEREPIPFVSLLADTGVVYGHLSLPAAGRSKLPSIDNAWKGFAGQGEDTDGEAVVIVDHPVPAAGVRSAWVDWMQRIIDGVAADSEPTLHYAHLTAPHVPWRINPTGTHYERPEQYTEVDGVEGSGLWRSDPSFALLGFQRHLYQVGFVDTMLGSLFEKLDETGTWDDTMIVVVADHGASFVAGEHRRWPYLNNRDDLYRVPLFVKYPGQTAGEVRDEPAFTIDILPTIVDTLDVSTDWEFDGISLLDVEGTDRPHETLGWCCNTNPVSTDLELLTDQVERNHEWVPDQGSWLGVAGVGPFADLVGVPVSSLDPGSDPGMQWSFDYDEGLSSVDRTTGIVQTLVTGRLDLPDGVEGDDLLIAVNGRVAGTGFLVRDTATGGEIRGLVDEAALADGGNEVTILVPGPGGDGWLTGSAGDLDVEYLADDGHVLVLKDEGNRRIQVNPVKKSDSGWTVEGWGADVGADVPPDKIYVFAGDTLAASGPPNVDNEDVVRWYKSDDLLRSGFTFDIDASQVADGVEYLVVVAEFGDYAVGDSAGMER